MDENKPDGVAARDCIAEALDRINAVGGDLAPITLAEITLGALIAHGFAVVRARVVPPEGKKP